MQSLTHISTPDLERLHTMIERGVFGTVFTVKSLEHTHLERLIPKIRGLEQCEIQTLAAVITAVLSERKQQHTPSVQLVWTGPDMRGSSVRHTGIVVRELLERAKKHVLIAGYSFAHGEHILEPLHTAMRDRSVRCEMFIHIDPADDVVVNPSRFFEEAVER